MLLAAGMTHRWLSLFMNNLSIVHPDGFYLVADTAFPSRMAHVDKKLKAPLKQGNVLPQSLLHCTECLALDCQLLSYRQTAEWGMQAFQGGFGHLRVPLTVDADA